MHTFGLLGHPLGHSFSRNFFTEKFKNEQIDAQYLNFDLPNIEDLPEMLKDVHFLTGFNVTIPYKEQIIPFLDELDEEAAEIGAVNVVCVREIEGKRILKGYNSDVVGFTNSIRPLIKPEMNQKALVLGTGGASKAVVYSLRKMGIIPQLVSRTAREDILSYSDMTVEMFHSYRIIVNTTPLGMYPNTDDKPDIPYDGITSSHVCFDLIYNPVKTQFLAEAEKRGATIQNGQAMLIGQALEAWRIWNGLDQ